MRSIDLIFLRMRSQPDARCGHVTARRQHCAPHSCCDDDAAALRASSLLLHLKGGEKPRLPV